eukprot:TRINITY_DN66288_c0_g1_i1.p3 TRINITY_DN66288_c0_g1~~TRINITY_DN66288_c0_g1_i1.p3  ORF type:complete len:151 (+),score=21.44 TRINITY_DN66288_c0_g1_i1:130-582(+)
MRKSRSVPMLQHAGPRQPLHPPSRPHFRTQRIPPGGSEYHPPALRWEHANTKLSSLQAYEERSVWARDAFDMNRPLQQRLNRPRPEKRWYMTDIGNKLTHSTTEAFCREAANCSWEMHRPVNSCPPPWAHTAHPRAAFSTSSCMSASSLQ